MLHIGWRSLDVVPQLWQPILFVSGSADALVPTAMMARLHAAAVAAAWREMYVVDGGGHNDCPQVGGATYGARLAAFVTHAVPAHGQPAVHDSARAEATAAVAVDAAVGPAGPLVPGDAQRELK